MKMRLLATALMALGASAAFCNPVNTLVTANKALIDGPSNVLKITELFVNPQGSDDGYEYIEIKNTGPNEVSLTDVFVVAFDNEFSQKGECDFRRELSGTLASGEVLVLRDTTVQALSPTGGTVVDFNFPDSLKNSGCSYFLVRIDGNPTFEVNDDGVNEGLDKTLDDNQNGVLDAFDDGVTGNDLWVDTYDHVFFERGQGDDPSGTDVNYDAGNIPGTYDSIACDKQDDWTPDGFMRLQRSDNGKWSNALIYDVVAKNGSNQVYFVSNPSPPTPIEYTFADSAEAGVPVESFPLLQAGNTRITRGLCNPASPYITVKAKATDTHTYSH